MTKSKLLIAFLLAVLAANFMSCTHYRFNDYRGYYRDRDYKEHHYKTKPHRDRN